MTSQAQLHDNKAYPVHKERSKLAVIAGGGELPKSIVSKCQEEGRPYFVIGIKGFVDSDWAKSHPYSVVSIGKVGSILKQLRRVEADEIVFAGDVKRPSLSNVSLDLKGIWWLWQFRRQKSGEGDNALLTFIASKLEKEGYKVTGAADLVSHSVTSSDDAGYTKQKPTKEQWRDIRRGIEIIEGLSALDIGQAVVIQDQLVLGVEAIEGTDELIKRTGSLKRDGSGPVLVKQPKKGQDKRLDLPTIGLQTIKNLHKAGFSGLAIEGGGAHFLQKDEAITYADKHNIFITATIESVNDA